MKKILAFVACTIMAGATMAYAGMPAASGISGSKHDMNMYNGWGGQIDNYSRVCVFCHTPHNATNEKDDQGNGYPLWNHTFSSTKFDSYAWAASANLAINIEDPMMGPSRLCMSCHDGSIAIDQHGTTAGSVNLSGDAAVGKDGLTNDHPIGFSYLLAQSTRNSKTDTTPQGQELRDVKLRFAGSIIPATSSTEFDKVEEDTAARTIESVLYNKEYVTCASCHDVHNKNNAKQKKGLVGEAPNYFLWAEQSQSLICLSCHIK